LPGGFEVDEISRAGYIEQVVGNLLYVKKQALRLLTVPGSFAWSESLKLTMRFSRSQQIGALILLLLLVALLAYRAF
jgi:hypothetical protein